MENIIKLKCGNIDISPHQKHWEKFEQNNTSVALNVLFVSHKNEEIKLAYKLKYNNMGKNQVIFLMVNDKAKKCYYFDVKNLLELCSSEWLRSKKAAMINNDNCFQNASNNALNYQNIENKPQRMLKIKPYISKYNWEGIEFPVRTK